MPIEVEKGGPPNGSTGGPFRQGPAMEEGTVIELDTTAEEEIGISSKKLGKMPSSPASPKTKDNGFATQPSKPTHEESFLPMNRGQASGSNIFAHQHNSGSSAADGYYETSRNKGRLSLGYREERPMSEASQFPPEHEVSPDINSHRPRILPTPAGNLHNSAQYRDLIEGLNVVDRPPSAPRAERAGVTFNDVLPPKKLWRWVIVIVFIVLIAVIIALGVLVSHRKPPSTVPAPTASASPTPVPSGVIVKDYQQGTIFSQTERITATDVIVGTYFGPSVDKPETRVVFDGGGGKLCVKTKLGAAFLPQIRCIEGTNAKEATPIAIVDWLGGPTIVFITKDNYLAGYNHVPTNDTWVLSPLGKANVTVHPQSQLSSVTWLNGTSMWIYYQGTDGQLHEWGLDDYRDVSFRDGSAGPLGAALAGSFFGVTRYVIGSSEYEEACYQATNGALHCRRYANSIWGSDVFTIAGTETGLAQPASFDFTTVIDPITGISVVAVAYVKTNGYITIQSRATTNGTDLGAFATGVQVTQGDGSNTAGLVITGESGTVNIYLKRGASAGGKIFQYSSNSSMTSWTSGTEL
jgi:hypothetical protein